MSERNRLTIADYEEVLADHDRLVRRLDVLINGALCASQASLCDLVGQLETEAREPLVQRIAESDWTDADLVRARVDISYGIPTKQARRTAIAAIRTLQAVLADARALVGPSITASRGRS